MICLIFLICIFSFIETRKVIADGNYTVYLNTDEILFLETPNFPQNVNISFQINFVVQNYHSLKDLQWFFADTVTANVKYIFNNDSFTTDDQYLTDLRSQPVVTIAGSNYFAGKGFFQGHVIVESGVNDCPFQSITRVTPFNFMDENQILKITNAASLICTWKFISPNGYKFKFVLTFLSYGNATLTGSMGEEISLMCVFFVLQINIQDFSNPNVNKNIDSKKYTMTTQLLTITFYGFDTPKFEGYLSVIKKHPKISDGNCILSTNQNITSWSTNQTIAYPNNAKCWYNFTVPWNKQIIVDYDILDLEEGIDQIFYFDDEGKHEYITETEKIRFVTLQSRKNGYNGISSWKFISDGSIQNAGFLLMFEEHECKCFASEIVVPCSDEPIMYNIVTDKGYYYCGGMECNVTFKTNSSCPEKDVIIKLTPLYLNFIEDDNNFYFKFLDYFKVTSDGILLLESRENISHAEYFIAILPHNHTNILTFSSVFQYFTRVLTYTLQSIDPFQITNKIVLTKDFSEYTVDFFAMPYNTFITVEKEKDLETDEILEVFASLLTYGRVISLFVFEGNNDSFVDTKDLFYSNIKVAKHFIPKDGKIKIGKYYDFDEFSFNINLFYFRIKKTNTHECLFNETVFSSNFVGSNEMITTISGPSESCEIKLLKGGLNYFLSIDKIFTTAKHQNCTLSNQLENLLLFEFNEFSADQWRNVYLFTFFYSIILPPNSSIAISFNKRGDGFLPYPSKTIWTHNDLPFVVKYFSDQNISLKFTIILLEISTETTISLLHYINDSSLVMLQNITSATKIGSSFSFTNMVIGFHIINPKNDKNKALIEIDTVKNITVET